MQVCLVWKKKKKIYKDVAPKCDLCIRAPLYFYCLFVCFSLLFLYLSLSVWLSYSFDDDADNDYVQNRWW